MTGQESNAKAENQKGLPRRLVFISHASKNFKLADELRGLLESRGIPCWIAPRDIPATKTYSEEIIVGIRECAVTVLVLTDHANLSDPVAKEIERSFSYQKPILPLRLRNIKPSPKLEFFVSSCQWVDAFDTPLKRRVEEIVRIVRAIEQGETPPPPSPEVITLSGRIEKYLEQFLRHKLLASLVAFVVLLGISLTAWQSSKKLVDAQAAEQAVVDADPATLGLVKLDVMDASLTNPGTVPDGFLAVRGTAYLNARGVTFSDVSLSTTAWRETQILNTQDLTPKVRQFGATDVQSFVVAVPPEATRVTVCMSLPHPRLKAVYTAKWSYRVDQTAGNVLLTRDAQAISRPGINRDCSN